MNETKFMDLLATIKEGEELRVINTGNGYVFFKNDICIDKCRGIDLFREEKLIYEIINDIGIPVSLYGYKYIVEAIKLSLKIPKNSKLVTKSIYPTIATCYGVSVTSVERSIRYAIETAYKNGKTELMKKMFDCRIPEKKYRPTNAQFINIITEYIRLKEKSL